MVKLNKIYTRTGDDGTTGLVDGSRTAKDAARMQAIGDIDEANSAIGLSIVAIERSGDAAGLAAPLRRIQNDLFDLGADIATPGEDFEPSQMVLRMVATQTEWLESEIDRLNVNLDPLSSFILPGGSEAAAALHLARAIARRAERGAVSAGREQALNTEAMRYLNRLSDYLFTAARAASGTEGGDVLWKPGGSR